MNFNTCRVCGKCTYEKHKYPMIRYGTRHNAHADCGLQRDGAAFFAKLTPYQLHTFPALAAIDAGMLDALRAAIAARPYQPRYVSPLGVA